MTRGEQYGLGLAVAGHVALFALLSLAWSAAPKVEPTTRPIEVSLVDDVALDQHAPKAPEPPAQSTAPDPGPPAEAPPPPKAEEIAPEPTPPKPKPAPIVPPKPKPEPVASPKPAPPKPAPPKPKPDAVPPPKPAPKPSPAPKKPVAEAAAKPSKAKPVAETAAKPSKPAKPEKASAAPAKSAAPATKAVAATKATGSNPKASKAKPTGSLLDDDFRKGLTQTPSKAKAPDAAPGATMDAKAAADIGSAIKRQVQPCADRQVNPGPGASRIVVTIRLSLNRDGTLNGRPTVAGDHGGVDDENSRYVDAVDRNAIATFAGCAPLRGLPPELYDVPRGWKTFILRYKLPG